MLKRSLFVTIMVLAILGIVIHSVNAQRQTELVQTTDRYGNALKIEQNSVTKAAHRVYGLKGNINRYGTSMAALNQENIDAVAKRFLADYQEIIKVGSDDLVLKQASHRKGKWYISYEQTYQAIPVYRTSVGFTIDRQGDIPRLGADIYPDIAVSATPSLSSQQARETAEKVFRVDETENVNLVKDISLLVYPEIVGSEITFHLVYEVELLIERPRRQWVYFVDAHSGDIVFSYSALMQGDWNIHGYSRTQYLPEHYYDSPVNYGVVGGTQIQIWDYMGYLRATGQANSSGYYSVNWSDAYGLHELWGTKTLSLEGSWVKILNAETKTHKHSFFPSDWLSYSWGWATDETNVYYHVDWIHDFFTGSPFYYSDMNYQMEATVHDGPYSNGWSDGTDIGFGSQDDKQWAKSSDVIYHEYTHCVVHHLYDGWIGTGYNTQARAMDEGFADYFACSINDDPIQGESVGVSRNIGYDYTLSDWVYNGYHLNGRIIAGACWDMRSYLGTTSGNSLTFDALALEPQADEFAEFLNNVLYEDDNDSDISNRTPHMGHICYSFYLHEIEPSDPECPNPRGDVNADGDLNVLDILIIGNIILEEYNPTPYEEWAADLNDDGEIDILDATKLANIILGNPDPPHEFPDPAVVYLVPLPGRTADFNVMLENPMAVGGIELHIEFDPHTFSPGTPEKTDRSAVFNFVHSIQTDKMILLLSSTALDEIPPGTGPIVFLPSENPGGGSIHITDAILCTSDGVEIPALIKRMGPPKVAAAESHQLPATYALSQNYPNPFNPVTTIDYAIAQDSPVKLEVYNQLGQVVAILVDGIQNAGFHEVHWDASNVASGVYFYRLTAGEFSETKRMVLMK
jgi:Zn-dependent metalloprotease